MKNVLFMLGGALLLATNVQAQINLTTTSYPASLIGTDSLKMTTSTSSYPSLSAATSGTWDLSTVTDSIPVFFAYRVPTSTYQFADSNTYTFGAYTYKGNVQSSNTATGLFEYGISILQANYSLTPVTFGATDSLFIPTQRDTFHTSPRIKIAFPATNHTAWSSVYTTDFTFQISVALAVLSHAPGITRTYTTEKDSVIGWGKMRVKDNAGNPSLYFNVLQVQTIIETVDSFFISGAPASGTLLTPLGLTQGKKDTVYQQNYYRMEEVTPLAQVTFKDGTYTTPTGATTHVQRLSTNAVANIPNETKINVYPNPVSGQLINVSLPGASGVWSYELIDVSGKKVQEGALSPVGGQASVVLPTSIVEGIYYLKVNNNGGQVAVKAIDVIK